MLKTGPDVTGLGRQEAREARIRFWREHFAAARASGGTQTDYCRAQGILAGAYFWWKKTIAKMDRGRKPMAAKRSGARGASFLPVSVKGIAVDVERRYVLEIDLGRIASCGSASAATRSFSRPWCA